jgi:hypothetical protein
VTTLASQVGAELPAFLRSLVERDHFTADDLLDVLEQPGTWEGAFAEWCVDEIQRSAPTREDCAGEEREDLEASRDFLEGAT